MGKNNTKLIFITQQGVPGTSVVAGDRNPEGDWQVNRGKHGEVSAPTWARAG